MTIARKDWIPVEKMVIGGRYACIAWNFDHGIWNGEKFEYYKTIDGRTVTGTEPHWDDKPAIGSAKPYGLIIIHPLTSEDSASPASETISLYHLE